jgi:hypothetical protein
MWIHHGEGEPVVMITENVEHLNEDIGCNVEHLIEDVLEDEPQDDPEDDQMYRMVQDLPVIKTTFSRRFHDVFTTFSLVKSTFKRLKRPFKR